MIEVWFTWLATTLAQITAWFSRPSAIWGGITLMGSFFIWLIVDVINAFYTSKDDAEDD